MRKVRLIYLTILTSLFFGCQGNPETGKAESEETKLETDKLSDSIAAADSSKSENLAKPYAHRSYFEVDESLLPKIEDIEVSRVEPLFELTIHGGEHATKKFPETELIDRLPSSIKPIPVDQFNAQQVLLSLFPGRTNYLHTDYKGMDEDSTQVVYWHCPGCERIDLLYANYSHWGTKFPGEENNMTLLTADYEYDANGRSFRLLSFATYEDEYALSFSGRFSGATMGLALFEKAGAVYQLLDFIPAINSFGAFNHYVNPEVRVEHGQAFFIYSTYNGGAGGRYGNSDEILWFNEHEITSLTKWNYLSVHNVQQADWDYFYSFETSEDKVCPDIVINMLGYYVGKLANREDYQELFQFVPEIFHLACLKADELEQPFSFMLKWKHVYKDGAYVDEGGVALDIKPLHGKWKNWADN